VIKKSIYFRGGCNFVNRKVFFVQTSIQFKLTLPGRDTKVKLSSPVTYERQRYTDRANILYNVYFVGGL
jgi:hypothetical protein